MEDYDDRIEHTNYDSMKVSGNHEEVLKSMRHHEGICSEQREFAASIITMVVRKHDEIPDSWKVSTDNDGSVSVASPVFSATYDMRNALVYLDIDGSKTSMGRNKVASKIDNALLSHSILENDDIMADIRRMQGR